MTNRKQSVSEKPALPKLVEPREEARNKLIDRIQKGRSLRDQIFHNKTVLEEAESAEKKWSDYNYELLNRLFDNPSIADDYNGPTSSTAFFVGDYTFHQEVKDFQDDIQKKIIRLESILERLDLIPEITASKPSIDSATELAPNDTNDVFIVHGHDEGAKESLARFLTKLDLNPIILHEQANEGRTIIEKFENHASSVGYAIVLITPDDIGYIKDKPEKAKPRARQNVIFELGYFIGRLTRRKVCALYKEGVEIPSDYQGVLFIPMDSNGAWKLQLAKEMKNIGLKVDMNKAI
jgi:predicted nucleotide-binding protein